MIIAKFIVGDKVSWGVVDGPEVVVFRGHPVFQGYETTGERIPLKDVQLLRWVEKLLQNHLSSSSH
ncbi:MAG: DUF2437 domain-containing protein [Micrococcales bacterium]|nr:DUF2437 domain-containing protein [Micrococcales bacterium]